MVPFAVVQFRSRGFIDLPCPVGQLALMQDDLHGSRIADRGTEERYAVVIIIKGSEPEEQRVVLRLVTAEQCRLQIDRFAVGSQRDALRRGPTDALRIERGTGSKIAHFRPFALAHRIIIEQSVLVSGEAAQMGIGNLGSGERLGPYTELHHVTVIEMRAVPSGTDDEGRHLILEQPGGIVILFVRDIHRTGVEAHRLVIKTDHHNNAREVRRGQFAHRFGELGLAHLAVIHRCQFEAVVGGETESDVRHVVTMRQKHHLAVFLRRFDEHIDGEIGDRQFTFGFRISEMTCLAVEIGRSGLRDTRRVGHAEDLEVIVLIEPVAGYRLRETEGYIVLQRKDTVGRVRLAEQDRRTGIFDTADDRRFLGHKARSVAAEGNGTQVVVEFFRITLAVEAERRDTSVLDHGFVTRCSVVEAVIREEGTLGYPGIVVLRGELVLEFDMVEVLMVDIESVDGNGQVVAERVTRREGVHHPFVTRISDVYRRGLRQIMHGELERTIYLLTCIEAELELHIVVVIGLSAIDLHGLDNGFAGHEIERIACCDRHAVDEYFRAIGIAAREREMHVFAGLESTLHIRIVHQREAEDSGFVGCYIGLLVGIDCHLRFGCIKRTIADNGGTGIVELGTLFALVRTVGTTAFGEEDITAVAQGIILHFGLLTGYCRTFVEDAVQIGAEDGNGDVSVRVRREGKAHFAADYCFGGAILIVGIGQYRFKDNLPFGCRGFSFQLLWLPKSLIDHIIAKQILHVIGEVFVNDFAYRFTDSLT